MLRSILVASLSAALSQAAVSTAAYSQTLPPGPIRIIVPFAAGSSVDAIARLVADRLTSSLGQPVVVENRAGARGFVAADFVAKSAPTGQTLLLATSEIPLRPVQKDLQPVGMIAKAPVILVANPKVGRSVKEFVANAANQPVASGTLSSSVALSRLEKSTGVKFSNRVAFAGSAPALTSILAGQVVGGFVPSTSGVLSAIRSGSLVALGITSRERSPLMPDVPTLSEQGFADVFYEQWFGLLAPAGTPRDVVDALNRALVSAVSTNEVRERFTMIGVVASPSSPGDFVNSVNQTAGVPICGTPCPDQCKDGCGDSDCCVDRY